MKVICEIDIGNNQEYPDTKVLIIGDPTKKSGFVNICIDGKSYEVRPTDVYAALDRVRSDE